MSDNVPQKQGKNSEKGPRAGKDLETMELNVSLSSGELLKGLKHYRRIARQDLLQAGDSADGERIRLHAESRREVYGHLAELASTEPASEVLREALRLYRSLPFVTGTPEDSYPDIKGRENALENFFVMINLEPRIRREIRSQRTRLPDAEA